MLTFRQYHTEQCLPSLVRQYFIGQCLFRQLSHILWASGYTVTEAHEQLREQCLHSWLETL